MHKKQLLTEDAPDMQESVEMPRQVLTEDAPDMNALTEQGQPTRRVMTEDNPE